MNKLLLIVSIIILFSGCVNKKPNTDNTIKYKDYICNCPYNKTTTLDIKSYKCTCGNFVKKINQDCQTTITQIYNSKASGKIVTCKGKLLEYGQHTRIIRVNE